ncbi:enoyl-CoA hydratase [Mergibacter septicus]|uniref:enoyl-CoA hydratase n=1 Tax=Mergibacter septicus TaxID=221402 RepID=UPI001C74983A|nr:enoyl-CoA hydratase [Mergibacter septicus]QDJ13073.1 enoyl-CoA hydratase [Mergibacter septicus]
MNKIYLALYKGKPSSKIERIKDGLIRFFTKGIYSHCELVVERVEYLNGYHYEREIIYDCYSSSPRDGGVRKKQININKDKWDLIQLDNITEEQIKSYFEKTKGKKYDIFGALGVVFGLRERKSRFFCSEWCFNAIFNSNHGWRFSPNHLAAIFKNKGECMK